MCSGGSTALGCDAENADYAKTRRLVAVVPVVRGLDPLHRVERIRPVDRLDRLGGVDRLRRIDHVAAVHRLFPVDDVGAVVPVQRLSTLGTGEPVGVVVAIQRRTSAGTGARPARLGPVARGGDRSRVLPGRRRVAVAVPRQAMTTTLVPTGAKA